MSRVTLASVGLAVLAALASPPPRACAQAQAVAVASFSGPRGEIVRRQVVQALEGGGLEILDDAGVDRADPSSAGARALVEGRVVRTRRRWVASLRVIGPDGGEVVTERVGARRFGALTARVARWAEGPMTEAIGALAPAPEPEPEPEPEPALAEDAAPQPEPTATEPSAAPRTGGIAPFAITAGISVTHRALAYNDDLFSTLRPYALPAAPFLRLGVEYFPGEHTDSDAFRGFSIAASGALAIAVHSVDDNGTAYPTDAWSFGLDLRYRLRVDEVTFRVDAGYHATAFAIHDANQLTPRPAVPNVETHSLRVGAGLRWSFALGLFFEGFAAYLHPFEVGEIGSEEWFPRATAGGVDVEGGLGVVIDDVEIAASFTWRRFFYDMHSEPGDQRVAGGAVDEYLSGLVRVGFRPSGL